MLRKKYILNVYNKSKLQQINRETNRQFWSTSNRNIISRNEMKFHQPHDDDEINKFKIRQNKMHNQNLICQFIHTRKENFSFAETSQQWCTRTNK